MCFVIVHCWLTAFGLTLSFGSPNLSERVRRRTAVPIDDGEPDFPGFSADPCTPEAVCEIFVFLFVFTELVGGPNFDTLWKLLVLPLILVLNYLPTRAKIFRNFPSRTSRNSQHVCPTEFGCWNSESNFRGIWWPSKSNEWLKGMYRSFSEKLCLRKMIFLLL